MGLSAAQGLLSPNVTGAGGRGRCEECAEIAVLRVEQAWPMKLSCGGYECLRELVSQQ